MNVRSLNVQAVDAETLQGTGKYLGGFINVEGRGLKENRACFDVQYKFTIPYDFGTHVENIVISQNGQQVEGWISKNNKLYSDDTETEYGVIFNIYDVFEFNDKRWILKGSFKINLKTNGNIALDLNPQDFRNEDEYFDGLSCIIEDAKKKIDIAYEINQTEATIKDFDEETDILIGECLKDTKFEMSGQFHYGRKTNFKVNVTGGTFEYDGVEITLNPEENNFDFEIETDFYGNIINTKWLNIKFSGYNSLNKIDIAISYEISGYKDIIITEKNYDVHYTYDIEQYDEKVQIDTLLDNAVVEKHGIQGEIGFSFTRIPKKLSTIRIDILDVSFNKYNNFPLYGSTLYQKEVDGTWTKIVGSDYLTFTVEETLNRAGNLDSKRRLDLNLEYKTIIGNVEDVFTLTGGVFINEDLSITSDNLSFSSKNDTVLLQNTISINDIPKLKGLFRLSDKLSDAEFGKLTDDEIIKEKIIELSGDIVLRCSLKNDSERVIEVNFICADNTSEQNYIKLDYGHPTKHAEGGWYFVKDGSVDEVKMTDDTGAYKTSVNISFDDNGNVLSVGECYYTLTYFNEIINLKMENNFYFTLNEDNLFVFQPNSYIQFTENADFFQVEYLSDVYNGVYYKIGNSQFLENGKDLFNQNKLLRLYDNTYRRASTQRQWIGNLKSLTNGQMMFKDTELDSFLPDLAADDTYDVENFIPKLMYGDDMFSGCFLDKHSIQYIIASLRDWNTNSEGTITLGIDDTIKTEVEQEILINLTKISDTNYMLDGRWNINIEWNTKI